MKGRSRDAKLTGFQKAVIEAWKKSILIGDDGIISNNLFTSHRLCTL